MKENEQDEEDLKNIGQIDMLNDIQKILPEGQEEFQENQIINTGKKEKVKIQYTTTNLDTTLSDDISFDDTSTYIGDNEVTNCISAKSAKFLLQLDEFLFIFILLISPSLNFNWLYFPFIFLGFLLSLKLFSIKENLKKFSQYFSLIYSIILIIFKIVIVVLPKDSEDSFIIKNKDIFIYLGVQSLKNKDSNFDLASTFIGECVVCTYSIISIIINVICKNILEDEIPTEPKEKNFFNSLNKYIYLTYFMTLGLAVFNKGIVTLVYIFIMNIFIFLISVQISNKKKFILFKVIGIIMCCIVILQIILINVFNTYGFIDQLIKEEIKRGDKIIKSSRYTKIGINYIFYSGDIIIFLRNLSSYLFTVLTMMSLINAMKKLTFAKFAENSKKDKENENKNKKILDNEEKEPNIFMKGLYKIHDFFTSPRFIIHICRILSILWIYYFRNFITFIVFFWLMMSFIFLNIKSNKYTTFLLLFSTLLNLILSHISNIDGFFEEGEKPPTYIDYKHICLVKSDYEIFEYLLMNIFYFLTTLFILSIYKKQEKDQKIIKENIRLFPNSPLESGLLNEDEQTQFEKNKANEVVEEHVELEDENDELSKKLTIINIILKSLYANIDKISLIIMYFVSIYSINIVHSILVFIFMIQLLFPNLIIKFPKFLIIICQLLFLIEYTVDILKTYFQTSFNLNVELLQFLVPYDKEITKSSAEIIIYAIVYCFYLQYHLYNYDFYKNIVLDDKITLKNYVDVYLLFYPIIKNILILIGNFILEIYVFVLIIAFIFFDSYFELNLLFEIKLLLFFIIVYQFLISIQKSQGQKISLCLNWLFLIYCSLNTIAVYIYQILCLPFSGTRESNNFFIKNLPQIGFSKYETNLYLKFLPHFVCNFISVLYIGEMKRILLYSKQIDKVKNERDSNALLRIKTMRIKHKSSKKISKSKSKDKIRNDSENFDDEKMSPIKIYEKNKSKMNILNLKNCFFNIILIITKFYWLFLFLSICIIFTCYDLSFLLLLYILIFSITFIRMFYQIIKKLDNFISHKSFFISRLIRYNLIEQGRHISQNKYYRSIAFKYLLSLTFLSFLLFYSYGIFYLVQNGCDKNVWKDCDESHDPLVPKDRKEGESFFISEGFIQSLCYLLGFFINVNKENILYATWFHLLFGLIIAFDVYVQKIENYFNEKQDNNRKEYNVLANENIKLKPLTLLGENNSDVKENKNILKEEDKKEDKKEENKLIESSKENEDDNIIINTNKDENDNLIEKENENEKKDEIGNISFEINTKDSKKEKAIGKKLISDFLKIFDKATSKDINLSNSTNKYQIIQTLKKIFEELIIFLLICTAISKLNIWSFIYMLISLYFIITKKSMIKYYKLYCFMIFSIIIQTMFFISNLQLSTDPNPDDQEVLGNLTNYLGIPWYKNFRNQTIFDDRMGFYLGMGVNHSQINLIWMEFIEVVIIYIYLDYFSYSIYQETNTIGRLTDKSNKINYYNLYLDKNLRNIARKLPKNLYEKHKECMKYNFNIDILPYDDFIYYMNKGTSKSNIDDKISVPEKNKEDEKKEEISRKSSDEEKEGSTTKKNNKSEVKTHKLKNFMYLSFHNVILIIIITISMLISSFISIFYIIYSLYFLIGSTSIYLGMKYYYPRAMKNILRITILLDITIQILYQAPYLDGLGFSGILNVIGLNKIVDFNKEKNMIYYNIDNLFFVLAKALTFLFMCFQLLVYSSQSFQEFYLSHIISKSNNLRRISLMNIFKFNNERVENLEKSISLRQEMLKSMGSLQKMLEKWSDHLNKIQGNNNKNLNNSVSKLSNEEDDDQLKLMTTESKTIIVDTNNEKYISEKIVYNAIKNWILENSFLLRVAIKIHKYSGNYSNIDDNEKLNFEKDTIQGKTEIHTSIERIIETELNSLDLKCFTVSDMKKLKTLFDGTYSKKLEEMKKKQKLKKAMKKSVKKIEILSKLKNFEEIDDIKNEPKSEKEEIKKIKKDDDKLKIDFEEEKFTQFKKLINNKLFVKYLKNSYLIELIFKDILYFCIDNFFWCCYLMMIIDHMMSSSMITLFYPISIFCYAIFEYPGPTKSYWNICLIYTIILLTVKYLLHLVVLFIKELDDDNELFSYQDTYKIGFKICSSSSDFFTYILYDALVLAFLLINNYLSISKGIWVKKEQEVENIYQAMERIVKTKDTNITNTKDIQNFNNQFLEPRKNFLIDAKKFRFSSILQTENFDKDNTKTSKNTKSISKSLRKTNLSKKKLLQSKKLKASSQIKSIKNKKEIIDNNTNKNIYNNINKNIDNKDLEKYDESTRTYYQRLFPKIRNEKPGGNFYAIYTISMLLIIIYILIFYTTMVQDKTFGAVNLNTNQFSGATVLFLLLHVIILFYDRVLYINQNRKNLKFDYILYDKKTKLPISPLEFNNIKSDITKEFPNMKNTNFCIPMKYIEKLNNNYDIVYIQLEDFNSTLLQKYILQIITTIFSHIFIFFYLPIQGNINVTDSPYCDDEILNEDKDQKCNNFLDNYTIIIFYIIYILYLAGSGLQIKYGFYDMRRKSMLKSGNNSINGSIYSIFKAIPFVYEVKLAIDWTFTSTSLDFFQWNKFESVYDIIYCTFCSMKSYNQKIVGQKIGKLLKIGFGGFLSFGLVLVLIIPLMLFSSLNPTNKLNNVSGAIIKIDLSFVYKNGAMKNYTLFENSKPQSINLISDNDWKNYNYSSSIVTKNFPREQVQTVTFYNSSDKNWELARPHIDTLIDLIVNRTKYEDLSSIDLILDYNFDRPLPVETQKISKRYGYNIYKYNSETKEQKEKLDKIGNALLNCYKTEIIYDNVYSPPIRLSANIKPKRLQDGNKFLNLGLQLGFEGCQNVTNNNNNVEKSYLESYFTLNKVDKNENIDNVVFHIFSDEVSTATMGYGILGLYTGFVLIIGNYVRMFFAGQPEKIMLTEMPHPEGIINLCEGIHVSRYSFDFVQEEKLYYILIELMRSPDYLRSLTKSSNEEFKQRQYLTHLIKKNEEI